jgi:hypothetical protein
MRWCLLKLWGWYLGRCAIHARPTNATTVNTVGGVTRVSEVSMVERPLPERITLAAQELKLARRDGSADWIKKSAATLDELIDQLPRRQET